MRQTLILNNLNCAHCAGKIEEKIAKTEGYSEVSFNFANKQLKFDADKKDCKAEIQSICDSIEDGVVVSEPESEPKPENKSRDIVLLIIAAVLSVSAIIIHFAVGESAVWTKWAELVLCLAATAISGYNVFVEGAKNLVKLRIDETTLLAIAVIAAFLIGESIEAAMVTILFSLGEFIEERAVEVSRRDIEKLASIRPDFATVEENGVERTVKAEEVPIGSTILVKPHERVPIDGIIISGTTTLDNSALTGESVPVEAQPDDSVMSGAINGDGLVKIRTTKAFGESTAARILDLVEDAAAKKGKREKLISKFASIYTPVIILIAVFIAAVPPIAGIGSFSQWLYRSLVILVASCPCAIVISVPLSYYSGIGSASRNGVLIKGGKYLEALAKADTFAFDKTGTLTTGELSVNRVESFSKAFSEEELLALAAACEKNSAHPIAKAIVKKAEGIEIPELTDHSEKAGYGVAARHNGKQLLCGGARILNEEQKNSLKGKPEYAVYIVYDSELVGAVSVSDSPRPEAKGVISELKSLGIKNTVILTGDNRDNAEAACRKTGADSFEAQLLPEQKLEIIQRLKDGSKGVCFTGDGINDAPVLSASDCGIAMGLGSEAAIEAADAVLSAGNLTKLPTAVRIARRTISTVKANLAFALCVKAAVIILATLGIASMWMSVVADTGVTVACVLFTVLRSKSTGEHSRLHR